METIPHPAKILVVDDEPSFESLIRQKFKNKIKDNEYEFIFSPHGQDALQALETHSDIELVLIDINMPVMDGFTLLDILMKQKRTYRIIIVTAYADMTNVRRAISKGASDFITKPIDLEDLEKTITRNLKSLASLRESEKLEKELLALSKELSGAKTIYRSWDFHTLSKNGVAVYGEVFPETTIESAFFDIYLWNEHSIGFSIGDVAEKGLPAALFTTMASSLFKSASLKKRSSKDCFQTVQTVISSKETALPLTANVFFGSLDTKSGLLRYVIGGGFSPLILSKKGELKEAVADAENPILTEKDRRIKSEHELQLAEGDILILPTRKLMEIKNSLYDMYGNRFKEVLKKNEHQSLETIVKAIKNDLGLYLEGVSEVDTLALFLVEYKGGSR